MKNDTITIIIHKSDCAIISKALEEYQDKRNVKKIDLQYGINKLRLAFQNIQNK